MDIFDPARKRGTLRPSKPKRKQKLKKQPAPTRERKKRLRSQPAQTPLTLRPRNPEPMPSTARGRRFRQDFGFLIRSAENVQAFIASARLYSLLVLVGCLYALYVIATNQRFYLNNVTVQGVSALSATDILEASGLRGAHIFAIEPETAAEAISAIAGVISAEVSVNWPDNVQIVVEEDTPLLLWNEGGRDFWVTESGTLVPVFNKTVDLLRVRAVMPQVLQTTNFAESAEVTTPPLPDTYMNFVPQEVIAGALELQKLYPQITEMEYAASGGLRFNDERGWLAKFGNGEEMTRKHTIYEKIAGYVQREGIAVEYISVSVVENPVFKPVGTIGSEQ